jgi:hypothetical protein
MRLLVWGGVFGIGGVLDVWFVRGGWLYRMLVRELMMKGRREMRVGNGDLGGVSGTDTKK